MHSLFFLAIKAPNLSVVYPDTVSSASVFACHFRCNEFFLAF